MRVWVDEKAKVWVNGTPTKAQRLAGAKRGSRIFSLTGLDQTVTNEVLIKAQLTSAGSKDGSSSGKLESTKLEYVQAGGSYDVRFIRSEFAPIPKPPPQPSQSSQPAKPARVVDVLLARYNFDGTGNIIKDVSGEGTPLDLLIHDMAAVKWTDHGLEITEPVLIQSGLTATKIHAVVQQTNEITIEAWIKPKTTKPLTPGPGRIVSLSKDIRNRNFTLGQLSNAYDVRLRTTKTSNNGLSSTRSLTGSLTGELTQVVFTRDQSGTTTIFLNGRPFTQGKVSGTFNWNPAYRLYLANEATNDRPWLGTYRLVAIYGRALSESEVLNNFEAGSEH